MDVDDVDPVGLDTKLHSLGRRVMKRWQPYFLVPAVIAAWALCMVLLWLRVRDG